MSDKKVQKLVVSALMAALTYVATMVVQIPSPMNGYVNLGDCFVLLSGWLLGPWYGGAAAGIGSMLTDLLSGYGYYAPGTFVIKGLDALVAALIFKAMGRTSAAAIVSGAGERRSCARTASASACRPFSRAMEARVFRLGR